MDKISPAFSSSNRQRAEDLLKGKSFKTTPTAGETETLKLIHELQVHQIELEMQNEELVLAREAAQAVAEKYTQLYDFAPSGYFTLSREGLIIEINLRGSQMLGKERGHLLNSRFGFFLSGDSKPVFNQFLDRVFTSKTMETTAVTLLNNDTGPVHASLIGIVADSGEQCLLTAVDTTDRQRAEDLLDLKNAQLSRINAEKDKFFSIIAHDLRNPFQTLLGYTQLMVEDLPSLTMEEIQKIAISMRMSASNLYNLLDNLLTWARMQRGLTSYEPESFLLMPEIEKTVLLILESAKKKGIEVVYAIPEDLEVFADRDMLGSVIRNLVSNAVKFTRREGVIHIGVKHAAGSFVEFSIQDNGIGMNAEILHKLFQLDDQQNRKGTEAEPSTGLGLIICKDFVEKQGGRIWAESKEGKGTTFYFTLKT